MSPSGPYITSLPIDLNLILAGAHHARAGAVVLFSGEVRDHHQGQQVGFLEYEAQEELANQVIQEILQACCNQWPLHYVFCQHRIGKVEITESAVVVVTSASHRDVAYEANRYIIDRIKSEAPIWKKEHFLGGESVWR